MKNYLSEFLTACGYSAEDRAFLTETYALIASYPKPSELWNKALTLYEENVNCDLGEVLALAHRAGTLLGIHSYTAKLLILLCLTKRLREEYEARGVDSRIYWDTVLDLKYKNEECKLVKGIVGTFVAEWFFKFFDMTRFALGRLQFQIIDFAHEYEKNGVKLTPQTKVIDVHIPRSLQPLDEKSCDDAFDRAKAFFADELGDTCAFVCHSWLLYPEHETMLSHTSNVYRFMKRFDIIRSGVSHSKGDLWRLFDTDEKDPDQLPADSSMRRAYVEHLKNGGKVGWGFGVYVKK